ncbi:hypothetical protein GC089_02730 [Cellulomonas sp. JZ18]|uniref:acyl-CoA dehydrogenase family protein n=1 Tax=Cellulomonas sp. JZ18 TaxID=2654191 RepID=UPI0012D3B394|nr:acyl-CoA dehydrogenase family protein [Cellulomonas sp. JZ18]QGQ18371.1 hypothetical protein GC089_02730 [Cellulomonas sp. JZ18]
METSRAGFGARPLATLGFRALQLSEVVLDDVEVTRADLLGSHLPPSRRGMGAATNVFYTLRPQLAASALGIACAAHDYVAAHRRDLDAAERAAMARFGARIAAVRAVIRTAAREIDAGRLLGGPGSASKALAVALADELVNAAPRFLGPGSRWEHPFLDKWIRDLRGLELMEGTSTVQKLTLAQAYAQRETVARRG